MNSVRIITVRIITVRCDLGITLGRIIKAKSVLIVHSGSHLVHDFMFCVIFCAFIDHI